MIPGSSRCLRLVPTGIVRSTRQPGIVSHGSGFWYHKPKGLENIALSLIIAHRAGVDSKMSIRMSVPQCAKVINVSEIIRESEEVYIPRMILVDGFVARAFAALKARKG